MTTYNPNIPQPTDNISTSQGDLLNNFSQLNIQFSREHTAFNTGTGNGDGHHKQITFNSPTSVATITSPASILFPAVDSTGLSQLFFANQNGSQQITGINPSSNLQFRWGSVSVASFATVSFSPPFPTSCFVVVTNRVGNIGVNIIGSVQNVNRSSFVITTVTSLANTFYYLAAGN